MIDLEGRTLLPGFIDAHGHISLVSMIVDFPYLGAPPMGSVKNISELINVLKEYKSGAISSEEQWIMGFGYDDTQLEEKRHLNRFDLDKVSKDNPVVIFHTSLHFAVCNSKALELAGINEETREPLGGVIKRIQGSNVPDGLLIGNARMMIVEHMPKENLDGYLEKLEKAQELYLRQGITTAQDGGAGLDEFNLFSAAAMNNKLKIDIVSYAISDYIDTVLYNDKFPVGEYRNHFKLGGVKILLDGSMGRTAWFTEPYNIAPEGECQDYNGISYVNDDKLEEVFTKCLNNKWQLLAHVNGDAAAGQYINVFEKSLNATKGIVKDIRPVMIHAQGVREDQVDKMKELDILPSFLSANTFYMGDEYVKRLGKERAYRTNPAKSAVDRDMIFTIHDDAPVIKPNILNGIWAAVNRESRSGKIIGKDQRISVMEALKAVTINAAYQYFEEDVKGSITVGKNADFVILNDNPLDVDKEKIKDISVIATIKEGKLLYRDDSIF
nr:amidohydrolase [Oceanirhabdus seepicola]